MSSTDDGTSEQSTANLMWTTVLLGNAALRRPAANTNGLGIRLVEGKDFRELISGCVDGQCNTYTQYVSIFSDQEQMGYQRCLPQIFMVVGLQCKALGITVVLSLSVVDLIDLLATCTRTRCSCRAQMRWAQETASQGLSDAYIRGSGLPLSGLPDVM